MKISKRIETHWETLPLSAPGAKVNFVESFDARGMRRVYRKGDHFGSLRGRTFNLDVWTTRSGRLLARFWSHASEVDEVSLEVIGFSPTLPPSNREAGLDARWVPKCLRDAYEEWIMDEFPLS